MRKSTYPTSLSNRERAAQAVLQQFAGGGVFTFRHDGIFLGKPGARFATRIKPGLWRWLDVMAYVRLNRDTGQHMLMPKGVQTLKTWRGEPMEAEAA